MKGKTWCIVAILFSAFLALIPAGAMAGDGVSLDIQVVYASMEKQYVDPTLIGLQKKLIRLFNYSSFEIISKHREDALKGEKSLFNIPGGRKLEIVPVEVKNESVHLVVKIFGEKRALVKTALGLERGSIVMLGGPRFKDGVLIILLSAD